MTTPTDSKPWTIPPFAASNGSAARVDCNLCDECMDDLKVDKTLAWMGHTDEGGGVMCDKCGRMQARLCFRVKPQNDELKHRRE